MISADALNHAQCRPDGWVALPQFKNQAELDNLLSRIPPAPPRSIALMREALAGGRSQEVPLLPSNSFMPHSDTAKKTQAQLLTEADRSVQSWPGHMTPPIGGLGGYFAAAAAAMALATTDPKSTFICLRAGYPIVKTIRDQETQLYTCCGKCPPMTKQQLEEQRALSPQ